MPEPSSAHARAIEWLEHLRTERRVSPLTLASYRRELDILLQHLGSQEVSRWGESDVRSAIAQAARQGLSPASIARRLSAWRGFFDWLCVTRGEVQVNPVRGVRGPRRPRRLPKALPPDQAAALMDSVEVQGASSAPFEILRDQAILELLYSSGLRLAELLSLDCQPVATPDWRSLSWLDLEQADVQVLGKGSKRRTVPVGRKALEALRAWLDERSRYLCEWTLSEPARAAARTPGDLHALFISRRGRRLSPRAVQHLVSQRARERGVPSAVHPHALRHSFASHVLQSSGDLRAVQELLGHASIASTQIYTALDFQRLAAVYDAAHPRARQRASSESSAGDPPASPKAAS
ncbi:MAG: tyrosine recombinase XerC [Burkholderiaceae bacterium]